MSRFILSREAERDLDFIQTYLRQKAGVRVARYVIRELRTGIVLSRKIRSLVITVKT
jgi:plasmid stabilization system protein ParE